MKAVTAEDAEIAENKSRLYLPRSAVIYSFQLSSARSTFSAIKLFLVS